MWAGQECESSRREGAASFVSSPGGHCPDPAGTRQVRRPEGAKKSLRRKSLATGPGRRTAAEQSDELKPGCGGTEEQGEWTGRDSHRAVASRGTESGSVPESTPLHDGGPAYPPARCRLPAATSFAGPTHRLAAVPGIGGTGNGTVPHPVDAVDRPGSPSPSATPFFGQAALVGFTVFRSCTSRTWLRAAGCFQFQAVRYFPQRSRRGQLLHIGWPAGHEVRREG